MADYLDPEDDVVLGPADGRAYSDADSGDDSTGVLREKKNEDGELKDGEQGQEKQTKKRRAPQPRPKLTIDMLQNPSQGIEYVCKTFPDELRKGFKGKGHEVADLQKLLELYARWQRRLFPYCTFDEFITKIEKFSSTHIIKNEMRKHRQGLIMLLDDEPEAGQDDDMAEPQDDARAGDDQGQRPQGNLAHLMHGREWPAFTPATGLKTNGGATPHGVTPGTAFQTRPVPALFKSPGPTPGAGTAQHAGRAAPQHMQAGGDDYDDEDEELLALQAEDQFDAAMDVLDEFEAEAPPARRVTNAAAATRTVTAMVASNMPAAVTTTANLTASGMPAGTMRSAAPSHICDADGNAYRNGAGREALLEEEAMMDAYMDDDGEEGGGENEATGGGAGSGNVHRASSDGYGNASADLDGAAADLEAPTKPSQQPHYEEEAQQLQNETGAAEVDAPTGHDQSIEMADNAMQQGSLPAHACDDLDQPASHITSDQDGHVAQDRYAYYGHGMGQPDHQEAAPQADHETSGAEEVMEQGHDLQDDEDVDAMLLQEVAQEALNADTHDAGVAEEVMEQGQDLHDDEDVDAMLLQEVEQDALNAETYDPFSSQLVMPFGGGATQPDASQIFALTGVDATTDAGADENGGATESNSATDK